MQTPTALQAGKAALIGLLLSLAGCSESGSDSTSGTMFIQSCSLGCANSNGGGQIGCSLVNISQNTEVTIQFSAPVDISSVNPGSFRLVNLANGSVPTGVFTLDPLDSSRLLFRPSLTFTGAGTPEYGFEPNQTYEISILGEGQDGAGPFIRSSSGKSNQTRMTCQVQTTEVLIDAVPGNPTVTAYVTDALTPNLANGFVTFDSDNLPVGGELLSTNPVEMQTNSRVVLIFHDLMIKATIASQLTGLSSTIGVFIDDNGTLTAQDGAWSVDVDFDDLKRTVAIFTPNAGSNGGEFPTSGGDPMNPRLIQVNISALPLDLVGNGLDNPSMDEFTIVGATFTEELLSEDFSDTLNEDLFASGGAWGSGQLTYGNGGGTGRLGPLGLLAGEELTLDTDSQIFPIPTSANYSGQLESLLTNEQPDLAYMPGDVGTYDPLDRDTWPTITSTGFGHAFEFSSVVIVNNSKLILTGSQPGRIFARGQLVNAGVIDLTGGTPAPHTSNSGSAAESSAGDANNDAGWDTVDGGLGGPAGPAAGAGGQGSDRIDMVNAVLDVMVNIGGVVYETGHAPAVLDGRDGGGIGGLPDGTGGVGGSHYPTSLPMAFLLSDPIFGNAVFSPLGVDEDDFCRIGMVAGPGSGGSHSFPGAIGIPKSEEMLVSAFPGGTSNTPGDTAGGDNSSNDYESPSGAFSPDNQRNLDFWRKQLRGGSGGGGGGTHAFGTKLNGSSGVGADGVLNTVDDCTDGNQAILPFWDHSAAGGGGGGGAVMLTAGSNLVISGQVDCVGGGGGSASAIGASVVDCTASGQLPDVPSNCVDFASPGGGGAGGAVLLQGRVVSVSPSTNRLMVTGGIGGVGVGGSIGGDGSPGFVRVEYFENFQSQVTDALAYAPTIAPFMPTAGSGPGEFNEFSQSGGILSIGPWQKRTLRPESYSGSQSCWMAVPATQGAFFAVDFVEDTPGAQDDLARLGWNMDVLYNIPGLGVLNFPYRGVPPVGDPDYQEADFPTSDLGGVDFQTFIGMDLNHAEAALSDGSLFSIRFQGVTLVNNGANLCGLNLEGGDVATDSLTAWVDHPSKLNMFNPKPNVIRFAVVFDEQLTQPAFAHTVLQRIEGVTNLRVRVQPD
ncbi:MAG: hypothetical protein ACI8X5_000337 [Planctomycetota bacterium]|jgi:hypothetical protein